MDRVTIINRALSRIGCLPIQSISEPGPAGTGVVHTYDAVVEDLLGKYPWHFTKTFAALTRLTETPPLGWRSAFMLPRPRLALPRAYYENPNDDRPLNRLQPAGEKVYTATDQLFAEYQVKPEPAYWPTHFRELVNLCLGAEYALEIREDPALRRELRRDAYGPPDYQGEGGQFKVATDLDAQAAPTAAIDGGRNPLTDVRDDYDPHDARCGW